MSGLEAPSGTVWLAKPRDHDGVRIGLVTALPEERLVELQELFELLDPALPGLEPKTAEQAVRAPGVFVFAAVDPSRDRLVGMATLVVAPTLVRARAWAEDLVVHPEYRGRRIAEALMDACAETAREAGARAMEGTVHPTRTSAIALHRRAGWEFGSSLTVRRHL